MLYVVYNNFCIFHELSSCKFNRLKNLPSIEISLEVNFIGYVFYHLNWHFIRVSFVVKCEVFLTLRLCWLCIIFNIVYRHLAEHASWKSLHIWWVIYWSVSFPLISADRHGYGFSRVVRGQHKFDFGGPVSVELRLISFEVIYRRFKWNGTSNRKVFPIWSPNENVQFDIEILRVVFLIKLSRNVKLRLFII